MNIDSIYDEFQMIMHILQSFKIELVFVKIQFPNGTIVQLE
jgi:hypothetical protein